MAGKRNEPSAGLYEQEDDDAERRRPESLRELRGGDGSAVPALRPEDLPTMCEGSSETELRRSAGTLAEMQAVKSDGHGYGAACPCCKQLLGCYCYEYPHVDNPVCPGAGGPPFCANCGAPSKRCAFEIPAADANEYMKFRCCARCTHKELYCTLDGYHKGPCNGRPINEAHAEGMALRRIALAAVERAAEEERRGR